MLTLTAMGKGTARHHKPVDEDPATNDEFSQQSVEQEIPAPTEPNKQKDFVILSLSMCTALNQ